MYPCSVIAERPQRKLTHPLILQMRKQGLESSSNLPERENKLEAEASPEACNLEYCLTGCSTTTNYVLCRSYKPVVVFLDIIKFIYKILNEADYIKYLGTLFSLNSIQFHPWQIRNYDIQGIMCVRGGGFLRILLCAPNAVE